MTEKFVIVHRTHDPFQAGMLGELLRENGIAARVLGTRFGAAIGVGQHILQQHIEVPQSQAGEATDFLESYFAGNGAELLQAETGLDLDADDAETSKAGWAADGRAGRAAGKRRPLFAAGSTLLLVGGSHFYAQRPWTALFLALGQGLAVYNMVSMRWHTVMTGVVMFFAILLLDLAGGQAAVHAGNRGVRVSPVRQVFTGAMFVALAGAIGMLIGPRVPLPERNQQDRLPAIHSPYRLAP